MTRKKFILNTQLKDQLICYNTYFEVDENIKSMKILPYERKLKIINQPLTNFQNGGFIIPGFQYQQNGSPVPAIAGVHVENGKRALKFHDMIFAPFTREELLNKDYTMEGTNMASFYTPFINDKDPFLFTLEENQFGGRKPLKRKYRNEINEDEFGSYFPEENDISEAVVLTSIDSNGLHEIKRETITETIYVAPDQLLYIYAFITLANGDTVLAMITETALSQILDIKFIKYFGYISILDDDFNLRDQGIEDLDIFPLTITKFQSFTFGKTTFTYKLDEPITLYSADLEYHNKIILEICKIIFPEKD
ncbi:MAG: hypothetical protein ACM3O3_01615 [Syntrophothermus sp.]